jgi:hypothetical protein
MQTSYLVWYGRHGAPSGQDQLGPLRRIDELCQEGLFRNRSEAVSDAIRMLLARYSHTSPEARATALYLGGRLGRAGNPEDIVFRAEERGAGVLEE